MPLYRSLSDRLRNQHEAIRNIIYGLDEKRLTAKPEPGKWSIHDNIAHLTKLQTLYIQRINKIISEKEPFLQNYVPENDKEFEDWQKLKTEKLLERMDNDRKQIYNAIIELRDEELARIGVHSTMGRLTLADWMESMLLHEAHHIRAIFNLVHTTGTK